MEEREFWQAVFIQVITTQNCLTDEAARIADAALELSNYRFQEPEVPSYQHVPRGYRTGDALSFYPRVACMDSLCNIPHPDPVLCEGEGNYPAMWLKGTDPLKTEEKTP